MTEQTGTAPTDRPVFVERVASNIRVLIARDDTTRAAVAEAVGIGQPGFSRRMSGEVAWSLTDLLALARYFRVPLSTITPDSLTEDVTR